MNRTSILPRLVLAICLGGACAQGLACRSRLPEPDSAPQPGEATLAQQIDDIRAGRTIQLRLDRTRVTDDDLELLDGLTTDTLRINFARSEITDAGLDRLCQLAQIEQLRLASPNVTDAGLAHLARLKRLRFLHLIDMPITDAGLDQLHGLTSLESLYLDGTQVTDEGLGRLVAALRGVHLHINDHHHPLDPHAGDHKHE